MHSKATEMRKLRRHNPRIELEFVLMQSNADQVARLPGLAQEMGISNVMLTNLLPHSPQMYEEILYEKPGQDRQVSAGVLGPPPWSEEMLKEIFPSGSTWPVLEQGWVLWGTMNVPRMYWGSGRKCNFVEGKSAVIGCDGEVSPCYALMYSYPYYLDNRRKEVQAYHLGNLHESSLFEIWNSPEYLRFRHQVRNYQFPSCMNCQVNKECEYAANNEDCWGSTPSCADCLWSQGIIRCP